jgi:Ca-activated chloride channel family protein
MVVKAVLIAAGALLLLSGEARADWASLWYRPDQQGEKALQAGDAKRAAELFKDPRRQAYAELMAQQYAAAAKRLAPFADAESQYNRGNALARGGDLKAALESYDAALKHADLEPGLHRDAEHNRDLVARQLKAQEKPSGESGGKASKAQERQSNAASNPNGKTESGAADSSPREAQNSSQAQSAGQRSNSSAPEPANAQKAQADENAKRDSPDGSGAAKPHEDKTGNAGELPQTSAAQNRPEGPGRDDAGQAFSQGTGQKPTANGQPVGEPSAPQSEQQLALEQWLRQIPDDPGGLLRRKFLVEHLMKQQQGSP